MAQAKANKQAEADAPPPRRGRSAAVAQDAGALASSAFSRKGFRDPTLVLRWSEIVGPEVARLAVPLKLSEGPSGGVLTLKAEPGASLFLQHETRGVCARASTPISAGRPSPSCALSRGPLTAHPATPPNRRGQVRPERTIPLAASKGPRGSNRRCWRWPAGARGPMIKSARIEPGRRPCQNWRGPCAEGADA